MYDLDAIENAAFALLHTDQKSATWPGVEDEFRRIAADPHVILYLVKAVKALGDGQAAGRETKMLANLVRDFSDYVRNTPESTPDPARAYLLLQADKVIARHHL
ncbi:hypothetical protein ACFQUU_23215 [Herbaspirillum sp. GCM10030257]|uniref:hypothetical protein n=1 Tax=Herbaspirillum sp. GCM10030257 TaxID=3273393 RepID=UPI003614E297